MLGKIDANAMKIIVNINMTCDMSIILAHIYIQNVLDYCDCDWFVWQICLQNTHGLWDVSEINSHYFGEHSRLDVSERNAII